MYKSQFIKKHAFAIFLCMTIPLILASCSGYPEKKAINTVFETYKNVRPDDDAEATEIMMHIYGNGGDAMIKDRNTWKDIRAIGWFGATTGIRGWIRLFPDTNLPYFVEKSGNQTVEPDPNMFLAIIADTNLDRKKILLSTTTGESPDAELMLSTVLYYLTPNSLTASARYIPGGQSGNAVGWTLAALADYKMTESKWKNDKSYSSNWEAYNKLKADPKAAVIPTQFFSMRDLLAVALSRPMTWGPNAGLNENYGIARAIKRHRIAMAKNQDEKSKNKTSDPYSVKLSGEWNDAQKRIDEVISAARKNQFFDGSFSSTWATKKTFEKNPVKRALYTGRMLDVMTQSLSDKQLKEPWVIKTVQALTKNLLINRFEISRDPFATGYALHALRSYRDRMPRAAVTTESPCTDQSNTCQKSNEK